MRIRWDVERSDIAAVQEFFEAQAGREFVRRRAKRNVDGLVPKFNEARVWKKLVACLLTTQQRSGPGTPVARVLSAKPDPLALETCREKRKVGTYVARELARFGGIRRAPTIGEELEANLAWLDGGGWAELREAAEDLAERRARAPSVDDVAAERAAVALVHDRLRGFGPRQARAFWQSLGLTRYEAPLDGRVCAWLGERGFPIELSAGSLGDRGAYLVAMDGFRELSLAAGVLPCLLHAAIFGARDGELPAAERYG